MSLGTIMGMRAPVTIDSLDLLETEAAAFVEGLLPKEAGATLVTLSGDLGAGKTAFTQAVARALGVTETVTSPTFVLAKSYALPQGNDGSFGFRTLLHIDAYRLQKGSDLEKIGFTDALKDTGTLILLEWPEIVADGLPPADIAIAIAADSSGARTIAYA